MVLFAAILGLGLSGCATVNSMSPTKRDKTLSTASKSVLLLTFDLVRNDGSRYIPRPIVVHVEKPGAQSKADRQNFKVDDDAGETVKREANRYLMRMAIEPGAYDLVSITEMARAFPLTGFFATPLHFNISVPPNSIVYLGRVTATLRDRKEGEFRAGPIIPLIDQAATGASGSTFDVVVENKAEEDVALFKRTFPALSDAAISVNVLPPFDRAKAQRIWDNTPEPEKEKAPST